MQQIQTMNDDSGESDIGNQVRKIVAMKQQLSKLKDMLELVNATEYPLSDTDSEFHENSNAACTKNDNVRQDMRPKREQINTVQRNEGRDLEKLSNKSLMGILEREKVLAELKAKKQELEEIMYKQKGNSIVLINFFFY